MKPKGQTREKKTRLPEGLEKRLSVYALAAAAGGVGMLAMAVPAQANDITVVNLNPAVTVGANGTGQLSINGNPVFSIFAYNRSLGPNTFSGKAEVLGLEGAKFLATQSGAPALLSAESWISTSAKFRGGPGVLAHNFLSSAKSSLTGPWINWNTYGYMGFKFYYNNYTYFGWARLKLTANLKYGETVTVNELAHDTCAGETLAAGQMSNTSTCGEPVNTPEPSTLALLAMGAVGLFALRRKKLAVDN